MGKRGGCIKDLCVRRVTYFLVSVLFSTVIPVVHAVGTVGTVDTDVNYKKHYNTGIATDPSYCIGYADAKLFQTGHQTYYKWMKQWYEEQTSSTDLSMKPFNTNSYINGTEMNNNDYTVECVKEFNYILYDSEE